MKKTQIVPISDSLLDYFRMEMDLDNQGDKYRKVKIAEFKIELTEALNNGIGYPKEIRWVKK